jgi:hypothetical protein
MYIIEYLRKTDETAECRFLDNGKRAWFYHTNDTYLIFQSLDDLIKYVYFGNPLIERIYIDENQYGCIFEDDKIPYDFHELKAYINQ